MKAVVLRFDSPQISFGSVIVDHHNFIDDFPGKAALTGLIGNGLGWSHGDFDKLQVLQERLDFAARWDVEPERLIDYHTTDLGQEKMRSPGWTTRGVPEHRGGGSAKLGIHQRYRHFWTDGLMTVALGVSPGSPDIEQIMQALRFPARPLFLGRKTCMPARPLLDPVSPVRSGEDLVSILETTPVWDRSGNAVEPSGRLRACWSRGVVSERSGEMRCVYDLRDWRSQLPAGSRWRVEGLIGGKPS